MTERKPPGVSWESWVDRQIREGMERGEFDGLPGSGKPIADLDRPRDEMWWVKDKLRREGVSWLPPALAVRKERDEVLDRIDAARTEDEVRRMVAEFNERVVKLNSGLTSGPPSTVSALDVETVVAGWASRRRRQPRAGEPGVP